jgi:hypothetical protein
MIAQLMLEYMCYNIQSPAEVDPGEMETGHSHYENNPRI